MIGKQIGSGGPGYRWSLHTATRKSNQQEYTVFKYSKPAKGSPGCDLHNELVEILKRDPVQLGRLRHPSLLQLEATVVESSDGGILFVTEPLLCSLGNALGRYENVQPLPVWLKEYELDEVEIQCGLLQIAKGLDFLHSDAKMIHLGVAPENIYINKNGEWKIGGFSFSQYSSYQPRKGSTGDSSEGDRVQYREWDSRQANYLQPPLNYAAPECVYNGIYRAESDVFSYAVLIYSCFNRSEPLFECRDNVLTYKQRLSGFQQQVRNQPSHSVHHLFKNVPPAIAPVLGSAVGAVNPADRPTAAVITTTCPYFESMLTTTIKYLDTLVEKEDVEKAEFLKGLVSILGAGGFSQRVQRQRILPSLLEELKSPLQIPFVLPNVFAIADGCSKREFQDLIFPSLIPVFKIDDPIQVVLILMQKMDLLLQKTGPDDMKNVVLPMVYKSLDHPSTRIQELCSKILPDFAPVIEFGSLKNSVFPRLVKTVVKCDNLGVKINYLVCLGKLMPLMDKFSVVEKLLPALASIETHEPGVLMAMLGLYDEMVKQKNLSLDKEDICRRILPRLTHLCIDPNLNVKQFQMFISVIKSMVAKVETEQTKKLIQMAKMDEQTNDTPQGGALDSKSSRPSVEDTEQRMRSLLSESIPMSGGSSGIESGSKGSWESISSSNNSRRGGASSTSVPLPMATSTTSVSTNMQHQKQRPRGMPIRSNTSGTDAKVQSLLNDMRPMPSGSIPKTGPSSSALQWGGGLQSSEGVSKQVNMNQQQQRNSGRPASHQSQPNRPSYHPSSFGTSMSPNSSGGLLQPMRPTSNSQMGSGSSMNGHHRQPQQPQKPNYSIDTSALTGMASTGSMTNSGSLGSVNSGSYSSLGGASGIGSGGSGGIMQPMNTSSSSGIGMTGHQQGSYPQYPQGMQSNLTSRGIPPPMQPTKRN